MGGKKWHLKGVFKLVDYSIWLEVSSTTLHVKGVWGIWSMSSTSPIHSGHKSKLHGQYADYEILGSKLNWSHIDVHFTPFDSILKAFLSFHSKFPWKLYAISINSIQFLQIPSSFKSLPVLLLPRTSRIDPRWHSLKRKWWRNNSRCPRSPNLGQIYTFDMSMPHIITSQCDPVGC